MGKRLWVFLAFVASLLLTSVPALAGTVKIRDATDVLTGQQESALVARGGQYPFDVRIVTSDAYASREAFDRYVGDQVTAPNVVVVGVDPAHRRTSVHVGTGSRIAPSEAKAIESAGAAHFKDSDFAGGVAAILDRAASSVGTATATAAAGAGEARGSRGVGLVVLLVIGGVFLLVVVTVVSALKRRAQPTAYGQGQYGGGPPVAGGYGPGYGPPGPGYYGNQGGSGIGTGIAGAALGGLVGYELGKHAGGHHGGGSTDADVGGGSDGGSYDAGGSTGGWDDSGGGGDFGGGGDSGGGGDW